MHRTVSALNFTAKREEQPNMDGNVLAKRIALHAVSEKATKLTV